MHNNVLMLLMDFDTKDDFYKWVFIILVNKKIKYNLIILYL